MTATQMLTRHGGWPNSVFLTPSSSPSLPAPISRPRIARACRVSHRAALAGLGLEERRNDVESQAASVGAAMSRALEHVTSPPIG